MAALVLGIGLPLVFLAVLVSTYFEGHPKPLRERRLWRGPLEECPRCHAQVPLGWIAYQRAEWERTTPKFLFALGNLTFESSWDHHFQMRGVWGPNLYREGDACAICDTRRWSDGKGKPMRPKFFEYGQNSDFGAGAA